MAGPRRVPSPRPLTGQRPLSAFEKQEQRIALLERKLDHMRAYMAEYLDTMGQVIADVELRGLYVMEKITRNRPKHAGLIIDGGKPVLEQVTLAELYTQERDAFVELLQSRATADAIANGGGDGAEDTRDGENAHSEGVAENSGDGAGSGATAGISAPAVQANAPADVDTPTLRVPGPKRIQ